MVNIAIVGATGVVGTKMIERLEESNLQVDHLYLLASARSAGKVLQFRGKEYVVEELTEDSFKRDIDYAIFSAGGGTSLKFAPIAERDGVIVIDNSSAWRMDPEIDLVVPECNAPTLERKIIANPNCSTIQMVQILKPLNDAFSINRVDVSTYQAASGAGKEGMEELVVQMQKFFEFKLDECEPKVFAHRLALNVIPHIDVFLDNDYTKEEMKMVNETQKILHKDIEVSATCVRVPVLRSHSEAITIHFDKDVSADAAREILSKAPSVVVVDNPANKEYPMPIISSDTNETYVGRIRVDNYRPNVLHLWCSADQIRVGAATNAVRIAQKWIAMQE